MAVASMMTCKISLIWRHMKTLYCLNIFRNSLEWEHSRLWNICRVCAGGHILLPRTWKLVFQEDTCTKISSESQGIRFRLTLYANHFYKCNRYWQNDYYSLWYYGMDIFIWKVVVLQVWKHTAPGGYSICDLYIVINVSRCYYFDFKLFDGFKQWKNVHMFSYYG